MTGISPLWRRSVEIETSLSCNDPQVVYYVPNNNGKPEAAHQDYSDDARQSSDIRTGVHNGMMTLVDDFFSLRSSVYPGLQLPATLPEMLYGEFVESMSNSEREMPAGLVPDDHDCGRSIVARS